MPIIVYDYEIGLDFHIITLRVSVYINEVFLNLHKLYCPNYVNISTIYSK